jgi:hypothetical protein
VPVRRGAGVSHEDRCGGAAHARATGLEELCQPNLTFAIYDFLLGQLRTSYGELRRVVAASDQRQGRGLAVRLGITSPGLPDHLDELLLDPADPGFDEFVLGALFGLRLDDEVAAHRRRPGRVLDWRRTAVHRRWVSEDRPANAPAGARPIVDPHLVGALDLVDAAPTLTWPRTARRPMDSSRIESGG